VGGAPEEGHGRCHRIWDSIRVQSGCSELREWLQLTNFWKADSHSASQEIPRLLRNSKVHYRVHNNPPLVLVQNHMRPLYNFSHYFPKIHSNIIFPSTPRSSEWSLPFRFCDENVECISYSLHACYMTRPSHPPGLSCFETK
jgi:hypothetical protein